MVISENCISQASKEVLSIWLANIPKQFRSSLFCVRTGDGRGHGHLSTRHGSFCAVSQCCYSAGGLQHTVAVCWCVRHIGLLRLDK